MIVVALKIIVFLVLLCQCQCQKYTGNIIDLYWRDYTGVVPEDAVPGGNDENNVTTYIGQGFVKDKGIIPGVIHSGEQKITVPVMGTKVIDTYIKILCSPRPYAFKWVPVKATELHLLAINKYRVKGGVESYNNNAVNIGRLAYQGEVITGKVLTGLRDPDFAIMHFEHKGKEHTVNSYEVLTFDTESIAIEPRIS